MASWPYINNIGIGGVRRLGIRGRNRYCHAFINDAGVETAKLK